MKGEVSKLNLRLPVDLREYAAHIATLQGLSLNAFITQAVYNHATWVAGKMAKAPPVGSAQRMTTVADALEASLPVPAIRQEKQQALPRVGANQPCPCGSGQKYKRCHGKP